MIRQRCFERAQVTMVDGANAPVSCSFLDLGVALFIQR